MNEQRIHDKIERRNVSQKKMREGRHNTLWVAAVQLVLKIRVNNFNL
jgi:hypothetical protein